MHQSVINVLGIGIGGDGDWFLTDNAPRVDVAVKKEGGDTRLSFAVDDGPVDRCCTAILRQQSSVYVEGTEARHGPYFLGQHAEGHHHLQVGPIGAQFFQEGFFLQTEGLQHGDSFFLGVLLDDRGLQHRTVPTHGLIGLCHDGHHVVATFYERTKRGNGNFGGSHEYNAQFFFFHLLII